MARGLVTDTVLPTPDEPAASRHRRWLPFGDRSRPRRLAKVLAWLAGIALLLAILELLGVDVLGWFSDLWDALTGIGIGYLLAGWTLQTAQTTLTAFGWYSILRVAFPDGRVAYLQILAAYAAGVALNGFLPANIGTVVMPADVRRDHPRRQPPRRARRHGRAEDLLHRRRRLRLRLPVPLGAGIARPATPGAHRSPGAEPRAHRRCRDAAAHPRPDLLAQAQRLWAKAVQGGAILARRREYLLRVALPSFGAWLAKLGVIAVFLAGYGITVTFHSVMSVMGGNSIANTVSVTPGGVGVNQATNVAALNDVTDAATATAYSLGQQLAITAWNIVFAVVLVIWAFGWTGGKLLVEQSYSDAKVKVDEQKAQRARTKATKHAERASPHSPAAPRRRRQRMRASCSRSRTRTPRRPRRSAPSSCRRRRSSCSCSTTRWWSSTVPTARSSCTRRMSGTGAGAAAGVMGGALIGLLFLAPLLGMAIGAAGRRASRAR